MNKFIKFSMITAVAMLATGCSQKYIETAPLMSYDITNVDISTLKSYTVCTNSDSKDVSVTRIAKEAGFTHVYAVDREVIMQRNIFSGDSVNNICITGYGK